MVGGDEGNIGRMGNKEKLGREAGPGGRVA